jgi:hypothetical protein
VRFGMGQHLRQRPPRAALFDRRSQYGADRHTEWCVERAMSRGMDAEAVDAIWIRLRSLAKNMTAANRTTVLPLAHRCLRAAYLKAHYPDASRAIVAAEGPD